MSDLFDNISDNDLVAQVGISENEWKSRHNLIRDWRDLRYGRDNVIGAIPIELQSTDFEYHSPALDEGILNLAAFLSAAEITFMSRPQRDRDRRKADDLEGLMRAVFGPNGILETESGGEVAFSVWEHQAESGQGVYKFHLKRDYPLRVPKRTFVDDIDGFDSENFEENDDFNPRSRKDTRSDTGKTRKRETNEALDQRRREFFEQEFPWMWRNVDPRTLIAITQDGVPIAVGEVNARPAVILAEHNRPELELEDAGFVYMQEPSPREGGQSGSRPMINTFEFWTSTHGYFGFFSQNADADTHRHTVSLSGNPKLAKWAHPYGRPPYYFAYGLPSTDTDRAYRYTGAFNAMIQELPLLNNLETMHFNAVQRGYFPLYMPVKEAGGHDLPALDNMEQLKGIPQADMERVELPPGWKWEVMPSGFEPDLGAQLEAVRARVSDSAINAVLTGTSPGAGDSGAKISLLINAASRALSPFVRHHEAPLKEMAETMLRVSKMLALDLHANQERQKPDGSIYVQSMTIKPSDIVTTSMDIRLDMSLPVDRAAQETRGLQLIANQMMSYETAAPQFFGVGDPAREKDRIRLGARDQQIDDIAFQAAARRFAEAEPAEFAEFVGGVSPPETPGTGIGGGPQGAFGGSAAALGQGRPSLPGATQQDIGSA